MCRCESHAENVHNFDKAQDEVGALARVLPLLASLRSPAAVRYGPRGVADDVLSAIDALPAGSDPRHAILERWHFCLPCILRFHRWDRFKTWRNVWFVRAHLNDDYEWLPVWASMVPPHGLGADQKRPTAQQQSIEAFFDRCVILGAGDDDNGLHVKGKKIDADDWLRLGGSVGVSLLLRYGVPLTLTGCVAPFFKEPFGNYKELHLDATMRDIYRRNHKIMEDWGMVNGELSFRPYHTIPQFFDIKEKADGSIKERGIQDAAATGLNAVIAAHPCVLPTLDHIHDDLWSGALLAMRDLTNAFWHSVYNVRFVMLLGCVDPEGAHAILRNLLMGLKNSPWIQQLLSVDLVRILERAAGRPINVKPYIDDFTVADTVKLAVDLCDRFDATTEQLKVANALKKATRPTAVGTESLGICTDTEGSGRAYPSDQRLTKYLESDTDISVALLLKCISEGAAYIPLGALEVLAGRLGYMAPYIWSGKAHLRPLYEGSVQFSAAREAHISEQGEWSDAPPAGWAAEPDEHIMSTLRTLATLEFGAVDAQLDHPLLGFWWSKKHKHSISHDPRFPVAVTRRLVQCLEWWAAHGRERAGVPLNLERPEGMRGRFRGGRHPLDHAYIDQHSRTREGDDVISFDAATHGDTDPRPRAAFWFIDSERHVITFPDDEEYGILWLECVAAVKGYEFLGHLSSSSCLWLRGDNLPVVLSINSGLCRNEEVQLLIEHLYELSWQRKQQVAASWFCTKCNWLADGISRGTIAPASCDFMFWPHLFEALVRRELKGKRPEIDAFANADGENALCPRFFSRKNSYFKADVAGVDIWINADFLKIQAALEHWIAAKKRSPGNTTATVLVPKYRRRRPWVSLLERHFRLVKTYQKGLDLFGTLPAASVANEARTRVALGPTRWPVQIWVSK